MPTSTSTRVSPPLGWWSQRARTLAKSAVAFWSSLQYADSLHLAILWLWGFWVLYFQDCTVFWTLPQGLAFEVLGGQGLIAINKASPADSTAVEPGVVWDLVFHHFVLFPIKRALFPEVPRWVCSKVMVPDVSSSRRPTLSTYLCKIGTLMLEPKRS